MQKSRFSTRNSSYNSQKLPLLNGQIFNLQRVNFIVIV